MRKYGVSACFLSLMLGTAPVYAAGGYAFQTDVDSLREDIEVIQRQMYREQSNSSVNNSKDLQVRLSEAEEQMRDMNGKIEQLEYKIRTLNERLDMINKDVDVRIKMIEGKPISGGTGIKAKTPKFAAPVAADAPKSVVGDSVKGDDLAPVQGQDVNAIYQEGLEALKAGNPDKAEENFNLILNKFSNDKLAGNAQYWLGEVYYGKKEYAKAAVAFGKGYEKYKDGSKGADSLYKLGMSMNALGKKTDACTALTNVAKEFPKAEKTLLEKAKAEAKKLKCK